MQKWISLGLVGLAVLGFVAERRLNIYDPHQGGKTKVRVLVASWQYSEFQTPDGDLERVVTAFEERHPDIDIDLRIMPEGNEITLMLPWQAGTTPFDLLLLINNETISRNTEGGFLTPLEEHLAPELAAGLIDEFVPGYLESCALVDPRTGKEHLYGLPFMGEIHALNYRRDMLAEMGLSEDVLPETWGNFEELARELRDPEAKQYGMAVDFSNNFFAQNAYVPLLRTLAGTSEDERGRLDVSSPEAAQAFRILKRWYTEGLMPAGSMTPHQAADDFRAEIAVMLPNWQSRGFWAMRDMEHGEKHIGIAPCPGSTEVGSLLAHYIGVIPKTSPVPREAARFLVEAVCFDLQSGIGKAGKMPTIKYIYDRETASLDADSGGLVPPEIRELRDLVDTSYRVPQWMLSLRPTLDKGYVVPDPLTWNRARDILAIEFQKYLTEDIPAEEALARAERQIDKLYE
jgi:ABC-type glycerol-3-phosphate transport system substrate-binding protein